MLIALAILCGAFDSLHTCLPSFPSSWGSCGGVTHRIAHHQPLDQLYRFAVILVLSRALN